MYPMRRVNLDTCAWEDTKLSENRLLEANDLFLNGVLDELRLVVDIEFAHQVEFVGLDGLYAEFEGAGDLFDGFAFGQHFENLALAFRERATTGVSRRGLRQLPPCETSRMAVRSCSTGLSFRM